MLRGSRATWLRGPLRPGGTSFPYAHVCRAQTSPSRRDISVAHTHLCHAQTSLLRADISIARRHVCRAQTCLVAHTHLCRAQRSLQRTDILCRTDTLKNMSLGKIWAFGTKISGNWWKRLGETGHNSQKPPQRPKTAENG